MMQHTRIKDLHLANQETLSKVNRQVTLICNNIQSDFIEAPPTDKYIYKRVGTSEEWGMRSMFSDEI